MDEKVIQEMIKKHEGYRESVYIDSVGVPTGGYGHAFHTGSKIPAAACQILFEQDYAIAARAYDILMIREKLSLDAVRRAVLIDMVFNMGLAGVSRFKRMLAALKANEYDKAADEMEDSKWYEQTGVRAITLCKMMRTGVIS